MAVYKEPDLRMLLRLSAAGLSDAQRRAMTLYAAGHDTTEIAGVMGVHRQKVERLMARAAASMRSQLQQLGFSSSRQLVHWCLNPDTRPRLLAPSAAATEKKRAAGKWRPREERLAEKIFALKKRGLLRRTRISSKGENK